MPDSLAGITALATGALDIAIGLGIDWRRSARASLCAGFVISVT